MTKFFTAMQLAACALATPLLLGCDSSLTTKGQVFIERQQVVTKLAQTEITMLSEEELIAMIKDKAPHAKVELEVIRKQIADARDDAQVKEKQASRAYSVWQQAMLSQDQENIARAKPLLDRLQREDAESTAKVKELERRAAGIANGTHSAFFYNSDRLHKSPVRTVSDANGEFFLKSDGKNRVAIVAKKDTYFWYVWHTPKNGQTLYLTEKNLNGTNCNECIFTPASINSTFAFLADQSK